MNKRRIEVVRHRNIEIYSIYTQLAMFVPLPLNFPTLAPPQIT